MTVVLDVLPAKLPHHHPDANSLLAGAGRASRKRRKALQDLRGVVRQRSSERTHRPSPHRWHRSPTAPALCRSPRHLDLAIGEQKVKLRFVGLMKK